MLPATERCGNSASVWKTIPMSRVCGACSVMSSPSSSTRPSVGCSRPAIIRRSVVFPQPDGPRNEMSLPGGSSRSTPATAVTSPKRLIRPWSLRPPRACTASSGKDHLRPLLVDPVLPLVVHLVFGPKRHFRTGATDRVVLLGGEVHRVPLRRRCRPECARQLSLDLRPAHVVDERLAGGEVLGGLRHSPEAGVEYRALLRADAAKGVAPRGRAGRRGG